MHTSTRSAFAPGFPFPDARTRVSEVLCCRISIPRVPGRLREMPKGHDLRCKWSRSSPDYIAYHDEEWGVPVYDDKHMFEHLLLETFQAGLSWLLILRRRDAFRTAFHNFDPQCISAMTDADVDRLSQDASIVRNRAKIRAAIGNARAIIKMKEEEGLGLAEYFWRWVGFVPVDPCNRDEAELVSSTELSDRISRDLKRRGCRFVGPTNVYAHLQATGIVNDHVLRCPQHETVNQLVWDKKAWEKSGVAVGNMGDAKAFWDKMDREESISKPSAKRRKSKSKGEPTQEPTDEPPGKRRRSRRLTENQS